MKGYFTVPSTAPFAWAVYGYIPIVAIGVALVVLAVHGRQVTASPNIVDVVMGLGLVGTTISWLAALVQIGHNLVGAWKRQRIPIKRVFIDVALALGLAVVVYYTALSAFAE